MKIVPRLATRRSASVPFSRLDPRFWSDLKGGLPVIHPLLLPVVYSTLRFIQSGISTLPVKLLNSSSTPVMKAPIWLRRPNPTDFWPDLVDRIVFGLAWDGNAWMQPRMDGSGRLIGWYAYDYRDVQLAGEDRVRPGTIPQWTINGQNAPAGLIHLKVGAAQGELLGRGMSQAGEVLFNAYSYAMAWTSEFYKRGATFQYALETELSSNGGVPFRPEEVEAMLQELEAKSGPSNAWSPAALPPGMKLKQLSLAQANMEHLETMKHLAHQIVTQLGNIPAQLYNLNETGTQVTYANIPSLRSVVWENCYKKFAVRIEAAINSVIGPNMTFNIDEHASLSGTPQDRITLAKEMGALGDTVFSKDEIRETAGFVGLPPEVKEAREAPDPAPMETIPPGGTNMDTMETDNE